MTAFYRKIHTVNQSVSNYSITAIDGTHTGTIGGGIMEAKILQKAQEILAYNVKFAVIHEELSNNNAAEEGLICGRSVDVMIEVIS